MSARRVSRFADDRGLLSTELAILMPVLVVVALIAVFAVQVQQHGSTAQAAADSAARAASYAASSSEAAALAIDAGQRVCTGAEVTIEAWRPPDAGAVRPGTVVVRLTCPEDFDSFAVLGAGGVRTVTATGIATIEYWKTTT